MLLCCAVLCCGSHPCSCCSVHHCGQAALVSGLYGGYATPAGPWLNYDAYNIKVTNNIVHDVWGAGLSVWGGYNILLAHNTLYK